MRSVWPVSEGLILISIDDYLALPEDSYLAWAKLEQKMRAQITEDLRSNESDDEDLLGAAENYQAILNSFSEEKDLNLEIVADVSSYADSQGDNFREVFRSIMKSGAANQIRAMARVASTAGYQSKNENSGRVNLTVDLRTEVLSKIETIRKIIYQANLDKPVESKILQSLSRFQRSVEEMRTSIAQYGQIAVDIAEISGKVSEKLDPALKVLERIGRIFKQNQTQQIEAGNAPLQLPKPDKDIPF